MPPSKLTAMSKLRTFPATLALVAFAALPLTGCVYNAIPAESSAPAATATPDSSPIPTTPESDSNLPATLTFADGDLLPESAYIQWSDSLMLDDGWTTTSSDDGNGGWEYGTADGTCTARFWQGLIADEQAIPGDDSASSDEILAMILNADAAEVTPHAVDGNFAYQSRSNLSAEHRQVTGQQDGRTWIVAARALSSVGAGFYLIVNCEGGDANAVFTEVVEKNPLVGF